MRPHSLVLPLMWGQGLSPHPFSLSPAPFGTTQHPFLPSCGSPPAPPSLHSSPPFLKSPLSSAHNILSLPLTLQGARFLHCSLQICISVLIPPTPPQLRAAFLLTGLTYVPSCPTNPLHSASVEYKLSLFVPNQPSFLHTCFL